MLELSRQEIISQRLYNNGLVEKLKSIDHLLSKSLGIQAQYINHALFNISTRLDPDSFHSFSELEKKEYLSMGTTANLSFLSKGNLARHCNFPSRTRTLAKKITDRSWH